MAVRHTYVSIFWDFKIFAFSFLSVLSGRRMMIALKVGLVKFDISVNCDSVLLFMFQDLKICIFYSPPLIFCRRIWASLTPRLSENGLQCHELTKFELHYVLYGVGILISSFFTFSSQGFQSKTITWICNISGYWEKFAILKLSSDL